MKKIILDARWIRSKNVDGIGNFTFNVIKRLLVNKNHDYYVIVQSEGMEDFLKEKLSFEFNSIVIDEPVNSLKSIFKIRKIVSTLKPDIYFSPCYSFLELFITNCQKISVIHDIIPVLFPELFKKASLKFKLFFCNKSIQKLFTSKIDKIIAVSESTKKDLNKVLNVPLTKVTVITEGFDFSESITDSDFIKNKYKLDQEFFLFVGRHEIYKNIHTLIKTYSKLSNEIKNQYKLVIIGKYNENTTYFKNLAIDLKEENIYFLNSVEFNELPAFYKKAKLLIHLSLYEGFGLTLLEAMSQGTPVIASNISSIPEVVGDAGILVNSDDEKTIISTIERFLTDSVFYNYYAKKSLERASFFNWDKTAKQIEEIFI